jgi:hypothetical protein
MDRGERLNKVNEVLQAYKMIVADIRDIIINNMDGPLYRVELPHDYNGLVDTLEFIKSKLEADAGVACMD